MELVGEDLELEVDPVVPFERLSKTARLVDHVEQRLLFRVQDQLRLARLGAAVQEVIRRYGPDPEARVGLVWLADSQELPYSGEAFDGTLSDGAEVSGDLDGGGRTRHTGIPPGFCEFSFPEFYDDIEERLLNPTP